MSLLLHCLGAEGQEVFENLPELSVEDANELNDFEVCIKKLDLHYLPKRFTVLERYHFGKRVQHPGESVEEYITVLRKLASSCGFGSNKEERLRDQFMLGCSIEKARESFWNKDNPSLSEVIVIAKMHEHSSACVEEIKRTNFTERECDVHFVSQRKNPQERVKPQKMVKENSKVNKEKDNFQGKCYRCGEFGHYANFKGCIGWKAACKKCGKKGHVTSCCRSADIK
ncbi:hypothetical protein NDU88_003253 [Pleurodeles waltl]|uniref:CCHC-type domain-containing protein n=1 Tax=Pleurodeles waltl TaxID=8319 RepID=A0AAV7NQE3_PLEWA|nr:hypothetical protein NDU88_003253 [Pleurodeles waltl]